MEFITNNIGEKFYVVNKFMRTFESQTEFTAFEQSYDHAPYMMAYIGETVFIVYKVEDAAFEDIKQEISQSLMKVEKNEDKIQTV